MGGRVNDKNREKQASHFDENLPFVPASWFLSETGFRFKYILKDVIIAQALDILSLKPCAKVLDVGCGNGVLLDRLDTSYQTIGFGVDISSGSLKRVRSERMNDIQVAQADAKKLPFASNCFDLSISLDVLEHIQEPELVIEEMVSVIRPGGKILCYAVSKKNRFTLIWFLTSILDMLGIDSLSQACHDPDLLVDPERIYTHLIRLGCVVEEFEHFHAFFTLMFDQALLVFYWIFSKIGLFNPKGRTRNISVRWILGVMDRICRSVLILLRLLDTPWTRLGLSNGFLVVGTNCGTREEDSTAEGVFSTLERSQAIPPSIAAQIGRGGPRSAVEARERSERT